MSHAPRGASPGLLRRRYSVPETVMRRCRVSRGWPAPGSAGSSPARPCSLLRRLCAPPRAPAGPAPPPPPRAGLLEVAVSETCSGAWPAGTPLTLGSCSDERNIDECVADILVESLISLTGRLDTFVASTEGRMSVVEKEIKVKLQNAGADTVVRLGPASINNRIVSASEEPSERDGGGAPRQARPPPRSLESDASAGAGPSPCTSLVDSLEDPASPRSTLRIRASASNGRGLPEGDADRASQDRSESFFVRLVDDDCACERDSVVVADHMPEKIKWRLQRRQRRRERRAEQARRGLRPSPADAERQGAALLAALIDDAIARVAHEEYRRARMAQRPHDGSPNGAPALRTRNRPCGSSVDSSRPRNERIETPCRSAPRPPPGSPARPPPRERASRRVYHKSETHNNGAKCIEMLEIVEFAHTCAHTSRFSSDTTPDECAPVTKERRSRIPVPIPDRTLRSRRTCPASHAAPAKADVPSTRAATERVLIPNERRQRSDSRRFERVHEVIPEERGGSPAAAARSPRRRFFTKNTLAPPAGISFDHASPLVHRTASRT